MHCKPQKRLLCHFCRSCLALPSCEGVAVRAQSLQQEWSVVCEALHLQPPLRADDPDLSRVAVHLAIQSQHAIPETPALKVLNGPSFPASA